MGQNFASRYARYLTSDLYGNVIEWKPKDEVVSIERIDDPICETTEHVFYYRSGIHRRVKSYNLTDEDVLEIQKMQSMWTPKLIDDPKPKRIRCQYCGCLSEKDYGTCEHCGAVL